MNKIPLIASFHKNKDDVDVCMSELCLLADNVCELAAVVKELQGIAIKHELELGTLRMECVRRKIETEALYNEIERLHASRPH